MLTSNPHVHPLSSFQEFYGKVDTVGGKHYILVEHRCKKGLKKKRGLGKKVTFSQQVQLNPRITLKKNVVSIGIQVDETTVPKRRRIRRDSSPSPSDVTKPRSPEVIDDADLLEQILPNELIE